MANEVNQDIGTFNCEYQSIDVGLLSEKCLPKIDPELDGFVGSAMAVRILQNLANGSGTRVFHRTAEAVEM